MPPRPARLPRVPSPGSARGWIYSITRHLALNSIRDTRRETVLDDADMAAVPTLPGRLAGQEGTGGEAGVIAWVARGAPRGDALTSREGFEAALAAARAD